MRNQTSSTAVLSVIDRYVAVRIALFLLPADMAYLGRSCRSFGTIEDGQQRSLANEAARESFDRAATEEERNTLPRYGDESYVSLLRQLYLLRAPLKFEQLIGKRIRYTTAEYTSQAFRSFRQIIDGTVRSPAW